MLHNIIRDQAIGLSRNAKRLVRSHPADHIIAWARTVGNVPVVGDAVQPIAAAALLAVLRPSQLPGMATALARSPFRLVAGLCQQDDSSTADSVREGLAPPEEASTPHRFPPLLRARAQRQRYLHRRAVRYGDVPGQVLDVWRRTDLPESPAPVMLYVPGGAWVLGSRMLQGYSLLAHMARHGWLCLAMNYRVSPRHPWPTHIEDVKTAVAWARANVEQFGGDPSFVAIAGASAGGHLAALAGLTSDDEELRAHLPADADTSVDAVVGLYGRYDWADRSDAGRMEFVEFLERIVVQKAFDRHPDLFHGASPISRVRPDAPPFLVVHGTDDGMIPVREARSFVAALRAISLSTVSYLELAGASHAFDMIDRRHVLHAAEAIHSFLDEEYHKHLAAQYPLASPGV